MNLGIPERTYLDTSILQTLHSYGEFLYDNVCLSDADPLFRNPNGATNLSALRDIMTLEQRATFDFVVSDAVINEVTLRRNVCYVEYALDIQRWSNSASGQPTTKAATPSPLDSPAMGFLGEGDRVLLREAVAYGCDAFLTMENKLPKNSFRIREVAGIEILSPKAFWDRVLPWAALFY